MRQILQLFKFFQKKKKRGLFFQIPFLANPAMCATQTRTPHLWRFLSKRLLFLTYTKNEHKFICKYPSDIILQGHCVVKPVDNKKDSNEITLLSFGGLSKHTLTMKYVSVWNDKNDNDNETNNSKKSNKYNQWIPFTNNNNNPIRITKFEDYCDGMRAVVDNHLLFITYLRNNIIFYQLNMIFVIIALYQNQKKCIYFENTLPIPLYNCFGILNKITFTHIIGGRDGKNDVVTTHIKTKVMYGEIT
ncbi:hypothetical protein RFI_19640 [Reticulomyxa filosa]|uniref:Uncharacterized protein n=1 Tax=Reticulomyxa filosa TaxID=46433 RepID=X6MW39_RETFI|nr:hypothetical protein RFI_19640 [Reticulomyxa filosa]|eukprot:ETO17682.1 hypothetical protein RFI_19640 [Reticulomyxa filosa]